MMEVKNSSLVLSMLSPLICFSISTAVSLEVLISIVSSLISESYWELMSSPLCHCPVDITLSSI